MKFWFLQTSHVFPFIQSFLTCLNRVLKFSFYKPYTILLSFLLNVLSYFVISIESKSYFFFFLLNFLTHFGLSIEKLLLLYFDFVISLLIHFFFIAFNSFLVHFLVFSKQVKSTANSNYFVIFFSLFVFLVSFLKCTDFQNGTLLFCIMELGPHGNLFILPVPGLCSQLLPV